MKKLKALLTAEAAVCIALLTYVAAAGEQGAGGALYGVPFAQIGAGLRTMSLSGAAGNAAAFVLYLIICLSPCAVLLLLHRRGSLCRDDILLPVLSAVLFPLMYLLINPGLAASRLGMPGMKSMSVALYNALLLTLIAGYLVLRFMHSVSRADEPKLHCYLKTLLAVICAVFVFEAFGGCYSETLSLIEQTRLANSGMESSLGLSNFFFGLRYAVMAAPCLLGVWVIFGGLRLIDALSADAYSEEAASLAKRLADISAKSLKIIVISQLAYNVLEILFMEGLRNISISLYLPLAPLAVSLCMLLFAGYIGRGRAYRDENERFI